MNKIITLFSMLFAVLFVLFGSAQSSRACSCLQNATVDKEFQRTPNVVVLKLRSVEKYADGEKLSGVKQSKLTVEKVFKGTLKAGQELAFAQGTGADCVWGFTEESIGEEFLVYLGEKPSSAEADDRMIASTSSGNDQRPQNLWIVSICSRSGNVKFRGGDLKFLESLAKVRGKSRLSGTLTQSIDASTEDETSIYKLLSNYKVTVKGNGKTIDLKTDENGFYEIYDLPAGKYTVTPEKIEGYKASEFSPFLFETEIKPAVHIERNFNYRIDNRVRGKFYDSNGKPLKNVCLRMLPARGVKAQYFYQYDCTKADGSFEFDTIPAGTYILVINDDNLITADQPFPMFYYPSAAKREDAAEINVGAGTFRDDLIITAPQTAETVTISGVVTFVKGRTPTKENFEYVGVKFIREDAQDLDTNDETVSARADVDEKGRFTLRVLKGWKGKLFAEMMSYEGEYVNCPKLDKLLRAQGDGAGLTVRTNLLQAAADTDLTGVELKFPFPSCKKIIID